MKNTIKKRLISYNKAVEKVIRRELWPMQAEHMIKQIQEEYEKGQ